jgi:DNA-binding CsgD family transcriptional regulator
MSDAAFLNELLEHSADGAYVVDGEQRIAAWNLAAEALLGFRAEDVVGQPCHQILGGRTDGGCVVCRRGCQPFTASRRGELVPSFDVQVRTANGYPRWVNVSIIALDLEYDDATVVVHLVRDIEVKKQAENFATEVATWARQLRLRPGDFDVEDDAVELTPALTKREFQILELLAQGASTEQIASQLVIGVSTVRNHIQRILHKLDVHSRLEAVTYARDHHLIE